MMKIKQLLTTLALGLSFCSYAQTFAVYKVALAPTIDGNISEWNTPFYGPFVSHQTGAVATQATSVSFSWDNQNLYVAYNCVDSKIVGSAQNQDAAIFNTDDLVELFIDADGDTKNYVELGVNAYSTNYDFILKCVSASCGGWSDDQAWDISNFQTAAAITNTGYAVEMKIPFSSLNSVPNGGFAIPVIGTKWKGNAFRIDYGKPNTEYLAIEAYTGGNFGFHQPALFKTFEFVDTPTGIDNTALVSVALFPNPFENQFVVTGEGIQKISVLHTNGVAQVLPIKENVVEASALQSGIYIVKIETISGVFYQKVVKQ
jgi:hypothetical protein